MQFLVHTGRAADADAAVFAAGLPKEIAQVRALYASSSLRQIWHRGDRAGAVLLLEAADRPAADAALASLPLVAAGAVVVESVVELRPYAGFANS